MHVQIQEFLSEQDPAGSLTSMRPSADEMTSGTCS